ncbi:phage portal protein [Klugiella xanthotipulae]|uniref:SPP1 Gp6-like portal protein n=1 Tax=Klugiella xanthotipulae TaxID=244735 RepID=A0A543I5L2_9MICO|nr:phage portal protein [Klugiella xanthotipulae]TQM65831.1 SPP1 Gp6-like portal protein [Klugiella xanthotipulae]
MATTPTEWLPVLAKKLDAGLPRIQLLRSYTTKNPPLPEMGHHLRASWVAFQRKACTNYGGLAVKSMASRMVTNGVSVGGSIDSPEAIHARKILRDNRWSILVGDAVRDYLTCGVTFIVTGTDEDGKAAITVEKPEQAIASIDPLRPWKARAFLKTWRDLDLGTDHALVWADGQRQRFERESTDDSGKLISRIAGGWQAVGAPDVYTGRPPVVILERPDGKGYFEDDTDVIDRINLGKLQRLVITAMQAFKQRGIKGLPQEDEDGNDIDWSERLPYAPGSLWDLPDSVDIWESGLTDIRPLLEGEKSDARDFAAVSFTPITIFLPDGENQTTAGAANAKEGQVSQARNEIDRITVGLSLAVVYALRIEGVEIGEDTVVVGWQPPDRVSTPEKVIAAKDAKAAGFSQHYIATHVMGMTPEEIALEETHLAAQQLAAAEIFQPIPQDGTPAAPAAVDPTEVKAQFDALGVGVRAGVDPDAAATAAGLPGIKFTGATPVSLRLPQAEADLLEEK